MSVVHQPVKDRVGDGGFADRLMPVVHRDLGGRERGTVPVTVVKNLKQIAPRGIGQRRHCQIVENHEIRLGKLCEPSRVAPAAVCDRQLLVQFRHAQIAGGEPLAARLDGEGATQPTLAESGRANEDQVLPLPKPLTGQQSGGERPVQAAGGAIVDVLGRSVGDWAATMVLSGVATFILAGSEESEAA